MSSTKQATADYEVMQPRASTLGRKYTAIEHTCCVCGYRFHSETARDARKVLLAVKVNRDGPYCILCLHLEMAARYAEVRGYREIRKAMSAWRRRCNSRPS